MEAESSEGKSQSYSLKSKADLCERAYQYSVQVIKFLGSLPEKRIFSVVVNQLLRSATSIGANVVEAKSASSKKDFIRYYEIALKSANETRY
jgi:four helix bundle protein